MKKKILDIINLIKRIPAKRHARRVGELYERYEHKLGPLGMALGVTVDFIAFQRIDLLFENLVLVGYLLIGAGGIVVVNLYEEGRIKGKVLDRLRLWLPLTIQYAFGGLLGAFMVFYLRSATIQTSWLFFVILLGLIIANELLRKKYLKLTLQLGIYYFAIYSYAIFVLPIILKKIGPWVFVVSSLVGLVLIGLFVYLLSRITPKRIFEARKFLVWSIGGIFVLINILYFTNAIPPIPLGLKEIGVFYEVKRIGNDYYVVTEKDKWYEIFSREIIHVGHWEPVYVFSAVFSPTDLDVRIIHHWQYKDEETGDWVTANKLGYEIVGGRDGGYRGYSFKYSVFPGKWRVDVETEHGQVIGRVRFDIKEMKEGVILEKKVF